MRIVRRDLSEEHERRRTPRLRTDLMASLAPNDDQSVPTVRFDADLIDLSSSGCAIRCQTPLRVGTSLRVSMPLADTPVELAGTVVRTWTAHTPPAPHSGIQFDPMPGPTTHLLNRFLIDQLRTGAALPRRPGND
jgi:hypothetical protein